jgi:hypothetical protein
MERQLLIVLTIILITASCQQLPVNSSNTNETSYDIPTDDPNSNLYTSYDIWQYLVLNNPQSSDYSLNERTLFYMNMHLKDDEKFTEYLNDSYYFLYFVINELEKGNLPLKLSLIPYIESNYDPFFYFCLWCRGYVAFHAKNWTLFLIK